MRCIVHRSQAASWSLKKEQATHVFVATAFFPRKHAQQAGLAFMEHDRDGECGKLCITQLSMWQLYVNSSPHSKKFYA